jgi:uncharacterized membrane protein YphA (DoxX/SURF4 family)
MAQIMTAPITSDRATSKWQSGRTRNILLWVVQSVLAALFLFAGGMKLVMPIGMLTKQIAFPGLFVRFIGVTETVGALGLILPWALGIRRELTPIAAAGLVVIMIGAVVVTTHTNRFLAALIPLTVGCLLMTLAYGRWSSLVTGV